jgi:ribosome-associated toxin RatA of RatAB toxin-antitoxin module
MVRSSRWTLRRWNARMPAAFHRSSIAHMRQVDRTALVPYSPEQMFALVADIERYPQFVPWVVSSKILQQDERGVIGRMEMERAGVREKFTTRNVLEPPSRMSLALVDGPFRLLDGLWTFEPVGDKGTKIRLTIRFEFANPLTAMLLSRAFEKSCADMVDAFVVRARAVYGG